MTAFAKKPLRTGEPQSLESRTFCRVVGKEVGQDGRAMLLLEPITDPDEQNAAHKRYEAVMRRSFRKMLKHRKSTKSLNNTRKGHEI